MTEMTSADRILDIINTTAPQSSELKHYGVLGMKWGVRKADSVRKPKKASSSSGQRKPNKKKPTPKTNSGRQPKSSNTFKNKPGNRRLTDKELNARISRIRMEQDYARLTAAPKSRGKEFFRELMVTSGQRAATTIANKATDALVQQVLSKAAASSTGPAKDVLSRMAEVPSKKKK